MSPGQVLGMQVWTAGQCDSCQGAFAQGGLNFPFEPERANMRRMAGTIPEHAADYINRPVPAPVQPATSRC